VHHAGEVLGGTLDRASLRDVVDAALDDERVGPLDGGREPRADLIGPLAVDPVIPKVERRVALRRPPLSLTAFVRLVDPLPHGRIRVPERRPGCDRITEARDDHGRRTGPPS
jgi:hypothetical protein